jgi:hypothetical protein
METTSVPTSRLSVHEGSSVLIFLVIQYLLGIYTNLFVAFPTNGLAFSGSEALRAGPVGNEILIGEISFLLGLILLNRSIKAKNRHLIILASIGVAAMALALIGGELFIRTQSAIASFLMTAGFVAANGFQIGFLYSLSPSRYSFFPHQPPSAPTASPRWPADAYTHWRDKPRRR